jgi:predicted nucleotide-binding protein
VTQPPSGTDYSRVFVVHGHDEAARELVVRVLEKLEITPVIVHEHANRGKTLAEKLRHHGCVPFAVVLLTPDDEGRVVGADHLRFRARQNVLLDLGYFVGWLGEAKVCALHRDEVALPADWNGVKWVPLDADGTWRLVLARALKAAGFTINMEELA